jgi:hypothetical protein
MRLVVATIQGFLMSQFKKEMRRSLFSGCSTSLVPWGVPGELITKEPMLGGVSTKRIGAELTATIQ